jgi:dolichyl-phosphate beta-glucosyltransferase
MNLSVIIPVHNGAEFLADTVGALVQFLGARGPSHEVIVVDDGSTDDTLSIAESMASERLRVVSLEVNRGKFGAVREGMMAARGQCRVFTDADIPYDHTALPHIERLVNDSGFHMVIGDRTLEDSGSSVKQPALRRLTGWTFRQLLRLLITGGVPDSQCGLKGFRADVADAIFPLITDERFGGDIELIYIALKYNLAIRRIPVRLQRQGASTVRAFSASLSLLRTLVRLRGHWRRGTYRSDALAELARQRYWADNLET